MCVNKHHGGHIMKQLKKITIIVTIFVALAGSSLTTQAENQNDALGVINSAALTLDQAAATTLTIVPGTVAKIEFSDDDDRAVWEIENVDINNQTYDLEIDANNGTVIKNEIDHNDDTDNDDEEDKFYSE